MTEGGAPQRSESDGDRDKTYLSTGDEGTRTRTDGSDNQWYCDKKTNSRPQPVSSSNASWNVAPCKKTNRSISPRKRNPEYRKQRRHPTKCEQPPSTILHQRGHLRSYGAASTRPASEGRNPPGNGDVERQGRRQNSVTGPAAVRT